MSHAPNILLITSDQQRYDTLGINHNPLLRTPHLDGLAAEGVNFDRAYVTNPVCVASRACIQTGRYTHQHGVEYMETVVDSTPGLPPWEVTFMERLQTAGYHTAAFGKMHMYPAKGFHESKLSGGQGARWDQPYGLPLGPSPLENEYATWLEARRPGGFAAVHAQRRQPEYQELGSAVPSVLPLEDYVDTWVMQNCIDFLQGREGNEQPFFLWCGFLNPHTPLDAPEPYDRLYDPAQISVPDTFSAEISDRPAFYADRQRKFRQMPSLQAAHTKIRRMLAFYYGLCTMLDDLSGRLFNALRETGFWDNTLILYTSDHGDMMGDFAMTGKANFMEGSIHVPLIVKPPRSNGNGKQSVPVARSRISDLVEVMDVAATVLDYAGLPRPKQMEARTLRPLIEGTGVGKDQVLCEYTSNDKQLKGKCLRTDRYKYVIWTPGREEELYDMQLDPQERHNFAADPEQASVLSELRTRLLEKLMQSEKPLMSWI